MEKPLHLLPLNQTVKHIIDQTPQQDLLDDCTEMGECAVDLIKLGKAEEAAQTARIAIHMLKRISNV